MKKIVVKLTTAAHAKIKRRAKRNKRTMGAELLDMATKRNLKRKKNAATA